MSNEQLQSDAFQELLAEALRAGPGSPAWKQAVESLRSAGAAGEEYAMLCRAREDLESGRDYRSIKAGPGFTQKLMTQIDQHKGSRWDFATANFITGIAISTIVIIVTIALYIAFNPNRVDRSAEELSELFFTTTTHSSEFRDELPPLYARIGRLPLTVDSGIRIDAQSREGNQYLGGGVYLQRPIGENKTVAVETAIEYPQATGDLITQLFVSDVPEFANHTGLSAHELVCLVENGRVRAVLPDGTTAGDMPLVLNSQSLASLRIRLGPTSAVVEHNNKTLWSGPHQLAEQPRYVGVRFLTRGGEGALAPVVVKHLRIMEP